MEDNKKINKKRKCLNYVLLMAVIILVAFIASKLYNTYKGNQLGESIFGRMVGNIQYSDIDSATSELPSDGFILISYLKNEDVNKFEAALKRNVVSNELQSNFYYLDATDLMLEDDYVDTLNEKFNLSGNKKIEELPAIIYYKDGELKTTITSTKKKMLSVDDFNKMLDSYEIIEDEKR
ncbi:MAG TPA: hypothetical protein DCY94_01640 [Firmicutes bacterium]|nr:hypothetical protein [Bacillota bacterium]